MIDASGTWRRPNPAGADGLPALGERAAAALVRYQIPDFAGTGAVRRQAHGRPRVRPFRGDRGHRAGPDRRGEPGHDGHLGAAARCHRGHVRRRDRRRAARARGARPARPAGCRRRARRPGDRVPHRADPAGRRAGAAGGGGRAGAAACRHGGGADRVPPGPVVPVGDAARPGPGAAGAAPDRRRTSTRTSTPAGRLPRPWRGTSRTLSRACTWWG